MKEAMKQWADDVSKAYDILAFGNTERASEILGKTRDAIRKALAEQHLQALHDENVRLGLYEQRSDSEHLGEPVAVWELQETGWDTICDGDWLMDLPMGTRLYTTPSQRTWVGLTDEEKDLSNAPINYDINEAWAWISGAEWAEAKLKDKNNG